MKFNRFRSDVLRLPDNQQDLNLYSSGDGETLGDGDLGGNDRIFGGANGHNTIFGDSASMDGSARGGNDIITGGENSTNLLYGDGADMLGNSAGGNDRITGPRQASTAMGTTLSGDAVSMYAESTGGDDTLVALPGNDTMFCGDAMQMLFGPRGGNDVERGAAGAINTFYGEAVTGLLGIFAGNDRIYGGASGASNTMVGDCLSGFDVHCGDDLLVAGDGATNTMYGDCVLNLGGVLNGSDRLVAGTGADTMTGDTPGVDPSKDIFAFTANTGTGDVITDFLHGYDHIDIGRKTGIRSFAQLVTEPDGNGNLIVHLDGDNQFTLQGVTTVEAGDFIFH